MENIGKLTAINKVDDTVKEHIKETEKKFIKYASKLNQNRNHFKEVFLDTLKKMEILKSNSLEGESDFNTSVYVKAEDMKTAVDEAIKFLSKKNNRLTEDQIKKIHYQLLIGINSVNKMPGEYRNRQVWIGNVGEGIEYARYIPPAPEDIKELMGEFVSSFNEQYLEYLAPSLLTSHPFIKPAILHAAFVNIHPFVDGNGRVARILHHSKMWQLCNMKYGYNFELPCLYLSSVIGLYETGYYRHLNALDKNPDDENWNKWFHFILDRMDEQLFFLNNTFDDTYENYKNSIVQSMRR